MKQAMSTRCQVRIVQNGYPFNLYHHFDGYFSGVGRELQLLLRSCLDPMKPDQKLTDRVDGDMLAKTLINKDEYIPTFFNHADIEYFYLIDLDNERYVGMVTAERNPWSREGEDEYDQYKPWYDQLPKATKTIDLLHDECVEDWD